ncbi:Gfo/Idh/MocA family protein [Massilia yuzhufengensis]|uniref:Predicted dehydrogenase n=1 Tax=Massilia yuzhufengensis TaxID=1164594 RepID=A0A1I1T0Q7_9BURK|nr:Gfo/Idh/MocA family oxidoreductase [Massilia yuzhufengensis]SFD52212.1 Predicted dehydrogenase [Massilia yuzhufengensis]
MANAVRWGILGTGKIARAFASALADVPGAVLAAVASRSLDKAQAFARDFGGLAFSSYQALADAADIDLVYVATPHTEHVGNALMALRAGKGVLVEKAFTMNLREAEQVVTLARTRRLFLMEAMWTRYLPAFAEVQRIIASGQIGQVRQVVADFGVTPPFGPEHRIFNAALGGGALLDLGIYPLSLAAALLGPVTDIRAQAIMGETGVDVQTAFTLKHADGGMSVCSCSFLARSPCELTVSGTLGHVRMNTMFHRATSVTLALADGSTQTIETPYLGNGYVHEVMEAQRCFLAGLTESPAMKLSDTLALMGVMDEIRRQVGLAYDSDR